MKGNYDKVKKMVKISLENNVSVLVTGHPGVGKSSMASELAQEFNLPLHSIRLSQIDPSELAGVMMPDRKTGRLRVFLPEWAPIDEPAFLFFDDVNAGISKLHQSVCYEIILDRRLRGRKFHPDTKIMAAGNLEEDNSLVVSLSQALNNRFAHFVLEPDVDVWLKWAEKAGVSSEMRAYISFKGVTALYNNTGQAAFPTPRSIYHADKLYQAVRNKDESLIKAMVSSCIGEGDALQFLSFVRLYKSVQFDEVLRTGEVPSKERSFLYAFVFGLSDYLKSKVRVSQLKNLALVPILESIPREFIVVFLRQMVSSQDHYSELLRILSESPTFVGLVSQLVKDLNEMD